MLIMEVIFWSCLFLTLYPYIIYPLLIIIWARMAPRPWRVAREEPHVSLIISVYNEEAVIGKKLANSLALDYPHEKMDIMVVSDGSTDSTEAIVTACRDDRVRLLSYARAGKTACLNRAVIEARGDIVVFTDANSMFPRNTLDMITRNFADEGIGLVTGWTQYRTPERQEEESTGLYARLEKLTKKGESLISSCVGADGAIFAIRRDLYRPLQSDDINDFVIPLNVLGQQRRVILDPEVFCIEEPAKGAAREFRRQARITNRTLGAIRCNTRFLNPFRYGSFAFFLLSHKVLRFLVPLFALMTLVSAMALFAESTVYAVAFLGMCTFLAAGTIGMLTLIESRIVSFCATFLLTNLGQMVGWFRFLTGRADRFWTPQR